MATYDYNYLPPYPQRHASYDERSPSRPPPHPHRNSISSFGGATPYTPYAAPAPPTQNPPYYPPTQQTTPPAPSHAQPQRLAPYGPPPQAYQQVARPFPPQQPAYSGPASHQQVAYLPAAPAPFAGPSLHPSSAYAYDQYETALAPRNDRRHSTSSAHSHRSRHSSYSADSTSDYSNRSGHSSGSRAHKKKKKKRAEVAALDRKPSYGDSVLLVWDVLKGAISGKRD